MGAKEGHKRTQRQSSLWAHDSNVACFVLLEISVLNESPLGHLHYLLTDVPPQPNSPPDNSPCPYQF